MKHRLTARQRELVTQLANGERVSDGRSIPALIELGLVTKRGKLSAAGRRAAGSLKGKRTRRVGECKIILVGCHV